MRFRYPCLVAAWLVLGFAPGALGAQLNFAPLVTYTSDKEGYTCTVLGPFLEFTSEHSALRPLFYKQKDSLEVLYPLGRFTTLRSRFIPLYRSQSEPDKSDSHTDLFPVFWGEHAGRKYGGVFPLYGTLLHRYGMDEAHFVLWPLYQSSTSGDVHRYSVLWPIFTYSPGREYKAFPLYGYERSEDEKHHYFLWPIFHHKRGTQNMDAVLPLFSRTWGKENVSISILWPFFTYNRDDAWGLTSMDMPWPLVRYATGPYEERRIFPLYWSKTQGPQSARKTILWPIYSMHSVSDPEQGFADTTTRIFILVSRRHETKQGRTTTTLHAWPIYYAYAGQDTSRWRFPDVIPWDDEGFARNWLPLLTLASGEKTQAGSQVDILWHTLTYARGADRVRAALSFLFSYEHARDSRRIGFLSDLVSFTWGQPVLEPSGEAAGKR
ncbi:MAG: hypothetical protein ABFD81_14825 [Syntrophaceae bacterium]